MIRSVKAIVRQPLWPALPPGTLIRISDQAFGRESGPRLFPATRSDGDPLIWVAPQNLLPEACFLQRQPRSEFWMLALKPPAGVESALQFVRDPVQQMWGSPAFRFKSALPETWLLV